MMYKVKSKKKLLLILAAYFLAERFELTKLETNIILSIYSGNKNGKRVERLFNLRAETAKVHICRIRKKLPFGALQYGYNTLASGYILHQSLRDYIDNLIEEIKHDLGL